MYKLAALSSRNQQTFMTASRAWRTEGGGVKLERAYQCKELLKRKLEGETLPSVPGVGRGCVFVHEVAATAAAAAAAAATAATLLYEQRQIKTHLKPRANAGRFVGGALAVPANIYIYI